MTKKEEKRFKCMDCEKATSNYYEIATNRGNIIKCDKCYELWLWRSSRISNLGKIGGGKSGGLRDEG
jgi:NAD-dependent SIR2 family protein deacetylase